MKLNIAECRSLTLNKEVIAVYGAFKTPQEQSKSKGIFEQVLGEPIYTEERSRENAPYLFLMWMVELGRDKQKVYIFVSIPFKNSRVVMVFLIGRSKNIMKRFLLEISYEIGIQGISVKPPTELLSNYEGLLRAEEN